MTEAPESVHAEVFASYLTAIREGDRRLAIDVVDAARESGMELSVLYIEVLQPSLRQIGQLWQENQISVGEEHLATAITQAAMAHAFQGVFEWGVGSGRSLIAACADTERHEIGLRMICDLLDLQGWDTTYLGASVPLESLIVMIERRKPDAVALSIAIGPHLPRLQLMIEGIRSLISDPPLILVGGRPFLEDPSLATRLGADLTAPDAIQAVALLQQKFAT